MIILKKFNAKKCNFPENKSFICLHVLKNSLKFIVNKQILLFVI